ncbi:23S rRNA (uracil(1939)-C(5))-methyltransferase RlmD [Ruminococcus flavefaciens]|uniref:23S rRNA (uracil(1939)-C(5))-methyltransferase RlmD n=1 Tax=Ruminococcus flavefaciens TaxID=1265 RepID=UPI0026EB6B14|nr:23S rRNA (uracil(1939)-C(5))-methyltransferase RlmD [Ruminococcus flavefaciens]MDD7517654.1 23S rRNA (uracil(1939)-C(5))-methyltransferase RlmD [Ruminococcus flavefaciens]MDY5692400.1 23S rRNA (uracil(1939)-C(5))-methyltransferase RlmD [Ruminococcus flavefaciens]
MPEKNQVCTAEITALTSEGSGVCRIDGMAVFVPETAVGDVCEVKIVKVLKSYAYGIVEKIVKPSDDRIENSCPVYKKCGGCLLRHISYDAECRTKNDIVRDAFQRIGGLSPKFDSFIGAEDTEHYRNKAQYPVAEIDGKAVCGFFAPRSHRIVPVDDCALQPKIFSDILGTVMDYINEKKLSAYNEASNTGTIRHIYLRRGAHSGEIMVCIVVRKDMSRQLSALCRILSEKYSDIKSIIMNINSQKTNVILGDKCVTLWGNDTISDVMCGNTVEISPLSFYQVNTVQAERLYAKALEYAAPDGNEVIADLYCGAGTIGLSMAENAKKIVGVEIIPQAVENAKKNAEHNNISNADFYCGDAGKVFRELRKNGCSPNIIVVDPPRKGCSAETIDVIANSAPQKIVMISCNPATAARDAKMLSDNGYSVDKVCGVDLFPRTGHVECVVLMSRKK